ncbi:hypothetical protein ACWD5V_09445 [Streptomyces sp. NPDC002523]
MESSDWIALSAAISAGVVAVWVPWLAFRFTLRQEQVRWLREVRAQLYVDLLTEAYAEQQWFEHELLAARDGARSSFTDLRMAPLERARLGTRANIYGSRTVNRSFNAISQIGFWTVIRPGDEHEAARMRARARMEDALSELQGAIRREIGTDRMGLDIAGRPTPSEREQS